ncbi:extracellular triacylglycerol lipase precursor [Epithele typhae]|uniref:extracellular triacylglycerol lipase precursor n=1 Tax=Epithele typhae TaxID=378194 RepID=UPI0020072681|nr:extracellular triacylglycerol lipase precursor [Epithele typhae]KAH9916610.1 extracellular triacylglycerol lipase precursor [Epithele typhae]
MTVSSLLASAFFAWTASSLVLAQTPVQVTLGETEVTGMSLNFGGLGVDFFGGLPFALPPLGELRFAPPVAVGVIDSPTFDATGFGPACAQMNVSPSSEDCLTLNVFRPAGFDASAALPVMVWIYGGGFAEGQTSIYNATEIIVQSVIRGTPVVYVSINYRVGPFGFPQGEEAARRGALNLGLKDQLAGLKWVQNNVRTFGGDPTKVTIFGQSAGAISIADLFLHSHLEKFVRGAIFESGSQGTLPFFNATQRQPAWDALTALLPTCAGFAQNDKFACAREASTDALLTAWTQSAAELPAVFLWAPVIDGPDGLIPDLPSRLLAAGKFSKIPFIAGTNLDDGTDFTPHTLNSTTDLEEFLFVANLPFTTTPPETFEADVAELLVLYPDNPALGSPFGSGNNTFGAGLEYKRGAALLGDVAFQEPRRTWIQTASGFGVPTFGYLFTDQNAALANPSLGVAHATEITYVYGEEKLVNQNLNVRLLSSAMLDYWLSFVTSLTPNDGKGTPRTTWPQYKLSAQDIVQFDTTAFGNLSFANFAVVPDTYRAEQISFIRSVAGDLSQ